MRNGNFRRREFDPAIRALMAEDARFPRVRPHDLRHTAASLAVSAGANVKAVQRMRPRVRGDDPRRYADLFEDDLDAVADALNSQAITQSVGKLWAVRAD